MTQKRSSIKIQVGKLLLLYSSVAALVISAAVMVVIYFQLPKLVGVDASIPSILIHLSLLLFPAFVLLLVVTSLIYHRLVDKPLQDIRLTASKIAESEKALGQQIPETPGLEFQELTRAFNLMSINLKRYSEDIEIKVNERTRLLEEGSRLVQEVLDTTPNMLCLMNTEIDALNYVNREFTDFFGLDSEELIRLGPSFIRGKVHPADQILFKLHEESILSLKDTEVIEGDFRLVNNTGEWKWLSFRSIVFQRNREAAPKLVLYVGQDITERKYSEEKLRFLSIHDQLTGLYNRSYFEEEIGRLERGRNFPISTIMADLDDLKLVNDTFGHAQGDVLLSDIAGVIRSCFRGDDVVARIGGDEFAALLPGADEQATNKIVQRILDKIDEYAYRHANMPVGISIGIHTIQRGESLAEALKIADSRMYQVKNLKKIQKISEGGNI